MELIPIKTRTLHPPKDDLFEIIDASLTDVREGDIILITSKVVAIHEGRCIPMHGTDKEKLLREEADLIRERQHPKKPYTVVHHALISSSGIDESNGEGYYILLPKDDFTSARTLRTYIGERRGIRNLGVVITDSHSLPFRYGAMSIALGCAGFVPVMSHVGKPDLFGRKMEYAKTNIVDALAAAATLVSGECDESQPIQIARGVPNIEWTDADVRDTLFVPYEEDLYKDLYSDFKKPSAQE